MGSADISHPDGQAERCDQLDQPLSRQGGEVVEERVRDGREGEPAIALRWGLRCKRAKTVVLPPDVGRSLRAVRDPQGAFERSADDPGITQDRTEDHLELHRVRCQPAERHVRISSHTLLIGPGLRVRPEKQNDLNACALKSL